MPALASHKVSDSKEVTGGDLGSRGEIRIAEPVTSPAARANAKRTEESAFHPGKRRFSQFPRHEDF